MLGSEDMTLITDAQPVFYLLLVILVLFAVGGVLLNGLTGTGRTYQALRLQFFATVAYLTYTVYVIKFSDLGLLWAWASEIIYWGLIIIFTAYLFYGRRWQNKSQ